MLAIGRLVNFIMTIALLIAFTLSTSVFLILVSAEDVLSDTKRIEEISTSDETYDVFKTTLIEYAGIEESNLTKLLEGFTGLDIVNEDLGDEILRKSFNNFNRDFSRWITGESTGITLGLDQDLVDAQLNDLDQYLEDNFGLLGGVIDVEDLLGNSLNNLTGSSLGESVVGFERVTQSMTKYRTYSLIASVITGVLLLLSFKSMRQAAFTLGVGFIAVFVLLYSLQRPGGIEFLKDLLGRSDLKSIQLFSNGTPEFIKFIFEQIWIDILDGAISTAKFVGIAGVAIAIISQLGFEEIFHLEEDKDEKGEV